jgi:hypothetical protein
LPVSLEDSSKKRCGASDKEKIPVFCLLQQAGVIGKSQICKAGPHPAERYNVQDGAVPKR